MPVIINEWARVKAINGEEFVGKGVATNLTAVLLEDDSLAFGRLLGVEKVRTTVVCDAGTQCLNGKVDDNFVTQPKVLEFDDTGTPGDHIKDVANIVITSDYKGEKQAFCTAECCASYLKHKAKHKNVIEFPAGKGRRTFEPGGEVGSKDVPEQSESTTDVENEVTQEV